MGKLFNAQTIIVEIREGTKLLERSRQRKWEDNIKTDLKETDWLRIGIGGVFL
jgi:hypothetical protein